MMIENCSILIVDDEPSLRSMLQSFLEKDGFTSVFCAGTAGEALRLTQSRHPDLFLLDVMLPDLDGFSLFQRLRTFSDAPVLFLSARDEDSARLKGLGLGADDYITKPFLPQELLLRIHAVLRRTYRSSEDSGHIIHLGPVTVNFSSGVVSGNGPDRTLTAKEYALLNILEENRDRIVTIDAICEAAWEGENFCYENTLMVHMRHLREKIELDPSHPQYLVTVRGLGYRLLRRPADSGRNMAEGNT